MRIRTAIDTLICSQCGASKPVDAFYRDTAKNPRQRAKSGRKMPCKVCQVPRRAAYAKRFRQTTEGRAYLRAANKAWHRQHPEYERARSQRRWREDPAHRAQVAAAVKRYAQAHPEYYRNASSLRRVRLRGIVGPELTSTQWLLLLHAYGEQCVYCGALDALTMDHLVPVSKGGSHAPSNIVPACKSCNSSKHANDLEVAFDRLARRNPGVRERFSAVRALALPRLALEMELGR